MQPAHALRQVKHAAFVRGKKLRFVYRRTKFALATVVLGPLGSALPYHYRPGMYARGRYALEWVDAEVDLGGASELPRRVFVVWTGPNAMTPARQRNLRRLRELVGMDVVLVTPANLVDWVVPGHPLVEAYEHLSLVHRSDYLRGYLMHHHGGGYADVKEPYGSWADSFDRMAADPDAWVMSYRATHANWVGKLRGKAGRDILVRHRLMFGKGAFFMRSHTPITAAWLARMEALLEQHRATLAEYPGATFGGSSQYPLSWTDLLSRVLDPLTLKHLAHIRYDERMLLSFEDYR